MIEQLHTLPIQFDWIGLLAQIPEADIVTPEDASLVFSGPQFLIALLSGLILSFGFHLLLTNLSIATGISYMGHSSSGRSSGGNNVRKIGIAFGIWTLVTVSLALFFASLLAVKLSLYNSVALGAITGLVIWGLYFCLLFWVSSTTVGSLIGSVVRTATSSFQSLVGTATAAMGAQSASHQLVRTAEATAAAVRQELTAGWDGDDIKETLQDYLATLRSPSVDADDLETEFRRLIASSDLTKTADRDILNQVDRSTFEQLVQSRTDLSRQDSRHLADRLYRTWKDAVGGSAAADPMKELVAYLKSASPETLVSEQLGDRLDQFLAEYRQQRQAQQSSPFSHALNTLVAIVMGRVDLSDLDVEKVTQRLNELRRHVGDQVNQLSPGEKRYSVVQADVENYLMTTYPWQLQPHRMKLEFWDVIYDPQADPGVLRQELMPLNRAYFTEILASRGLLTQAEIARVSAQLDEVRQQVQAELAERYRIEAAKALQQQVYTFLRQTPRDELMTDMGTRAFHSLIEDPYAEPDELSDRFTPFGYEAFLDALRSRADMDEADAQAIASRFETEMNTVQADAQGLQAAAQARLENQWTSLKHYLNSTGKSELHPEGIKSDVQLLLHEPDAGMHRIRQRLAQFDRDTLVQLLSQRQDLSESEVRRTLDQVEAVWLQTVNAPADLTAQAKAKYNEATAALETYLLKTGKPELNPTGIKHDLELLLSDPKVGMQAMRQRLSEVDRDTLVQLLSQRDDLTEADVNQIIDDVLMTAKDLLNLPQRLARRAQAKVLSFETALEDYLRNTDKESLNPDGIKRDLKLLLDDPRLGADRLQSRLAKIDRSTVIALLAQRPDMSEAEAAAAVDRVLSVRDQITAQVQQVQEQIMAIVRSILARIRTYLNSLGRPELNYYGIKHDLKQLFDNPQAGLEAIRLRLSQIDRETLVALLSSHDGISEMEANRLIGQIEEVRDSALQKAERLEQAVEHRLGELKHQADQQIEDTRKTAAAAAWWIFGTAATSAVCATVAGALATL